MSAQTILTLSNGKGIDLLDPDPAAIDFASLAEHLAKEKRFNGATPDIEYSVAQHCSIGCDAMLAAGFSETEAAYFLLHDAHEAFIKDDTTPKKRALAEIAETRFGVLAGHIICAFDFLTYRIDTAIHYAAGLEWPARARVQVAVKKFDLILFVTEWRDLMHGVPHPNWTPYSGIKPLPKRIEPQAWAHARAAWLLRANRLLPHLRKPVVTDDRQSDLSRRIESKQTATP